MRHNQDNVFTRIADRLLDNEDASVKSVVSADFYYHNLCLQNYLRRYEPSTAIQEDTTTSINDMKPGGDRENLVLVQTEVSRVGAASCLQRRGPLVLMGDQESTEALADEGAVSGPEQVHHTVEEENDPDLLSLAFVDPGCGLQERGELGNPEGLLGLGGGEAPRQRRGSTSRSFSLSTESVEEGEGESGAPAPAIAASG